MSKRYMQAVRALSRFGELAWFKLPMEYNPVHGYHQVPHMGWRYTSPNEDIARLIENAVEGLSTHVELLTEQEGTGSYYRAGFYAKRKG